MDQKIYILSIDNYAWIIPFRDEEERILVESIEKGEWVPVDDLQTAINEAKSLAI